MRKLGMKPYSITGVRWHHETGARIVEIGDRIDGRDKEEVTDPTEIITVLTKAGMEFHLTDEEKVLAHRLEREQASMEASSTWGAWG